MKRLLPLICLLVGFAIMQQSGFSQDPTFKKKSMKEWASKARDPDPYVRIRVTYALYTVVSEVGPKNAKELLPTLKESLMDEEDRVRRYAAWTLGKFGAVAREAVPDLIKALDDSDPLVRGFACEALGLMGAEAKTAVPAITKLLDDPQWVTRRLAALSLGEMGAAAKPSVEALQKALADPNDEVRRAGLMAIGKLGGIAQAALPTVTLAIKDTDPQVRRVALQVLMVFKIDGPKVKELIPIITQACDDEDAFVADAAGDTLKIFATAALASILPNLESPKPGSRYFTAMAIGYLGPKGKTAVAGLVKLLKDPEDKIKARAAASLGAIGPDAAKALPPLREAAAGTNPQLRSRALEAIKLIETKPGK